MYDHVLRISESSDALRDIGVPTLITGYYGMNVPYPGSGATTGAVVPVALAVAIPTGLYPYVRHRDWL